jgi:ribosome-binding protein aMBF1 (putative translation factor)
MENQCAICGDIRNAADTDASGHHNVCDACYDEIGRETLTFETESTPSGIDDDIPF